MFPARDKRRRLWNLRASPFPRASVRSPLSSPGPSLFLRPDFQRRNYLGASCSPYLADRPAQDYMDGVLPAAGLERNSTVGGCFPIHRN